MKRKTISIQVIHLTTPIHPIDPGDNPVDDHMELKYDTDELESDTPTGDPPDSTAETERPLSLHRAASFWEVRALHQLLAPFDPKHIQPSLDSHDIPHTRSGRVIRSSQSITSNPNNYYAADMHHALTHLAEEHVNAAIIDSLSIPSPSSIRMRFDLLRHNSGRKQ